MNIWFTSDLHLGHSKICSYYNRPFKSLEEMDATLITNWNQKVKKDDIVFFLGDFCLQKSSEASDSKGFNYYRNQLNGHIVFVNGNHDTNKRNGLRTIIEGIVINYGGYFIYLTHKPENAKTEYKLNFCGHKHGKEGKFVKKGRTTIIDLSVENWKFSPVSIGEILSDYYKWNKEQK